MIVDHKQLQWYKDMIFPLVLAVATLILIPFVYAAEKEASQVFGGSVWFLWTWILGLFLTNAVTFVGVVLRKKEKSLFIWFEYPGSIMAAFAMLVYAGTIVVGGPGGGALGIAVTLVIACHYTINFLIIHHSIFSKK